MFYWCYEKLRKASRIKKISRWTENIWRKIPDRLELWRSEGTRLCLRGKLDFCKPGCFLGCLKLCERCSEPVFTGVSLLGSLEVERKKHASEGIFRTVFKSWSYQPDLRGICFFAFWMFSSLYLLESIAANIGCPNEGECYRWLSNILNTGRERWM